MANQIVMRRERNQLTINCIVHIKDRMKLCSKNPPNNGEFHCTDIGELNGRLPCNKCQQTDYVRSDRGFIHT